MIPYKKEKIENAICFFATEHKKKTKKTLYQTSLYKYLAFLDFESIKKTGRPALGLIYKAMQWGPVPIEIYEQREQYSTSLFDFKKDNNNIIVVCKKKPNLDYFSKHEINLMNKLIEIYARSYVYAELISDASHEAILAWEKTWKRNPNGIIDYASTFDDNLLEKSDDELSYPEENYLTYKAIGKY